MGMHFKTSYNHRERALSQLADLYSSAEHFGMLSQEISERRNKIMETIAKCPQWVHSFLSGWERCRLLLHHAGWPATVNSPGPR
jgi:hypothetical protein